jgi:hypothetical protein
MTPWYGPALMGWWRRFDRWCQDHWVLAAAVAGLIVGAFIAVRAGDLVGGLLAGCILFALNAAFGWAGYG